ncbi:MAG: hypothetical protein B6A08_01590 [Sorangiineae bacterium NIC37A_2]|nr:MAG: hypothetical protein B6A08_01590 [Sorangiineae bacterium NIC37A_2]
MITARMDRRLPALLFATLLGIGGSLAFASCCDYGKGASSVETAARPTLRIYALGAAAGAIEPCGCVEDMLGGVDHLAALLTDEKKVAPASLLLSAGPMFFSDPTVPEEQRAQAIMKAETMAEALGIMGLTAFAPGVNDFALGPQEFERFTRLAKSAPLAANHAGRQGIKAHSIVEAGGLKVGLVGGADLSEAKALGAESNELLASLKSAVEAAQKEGAQLVVALLALPRGPALRLIEQLDAVDVAIVGKNIEAGENNDPPFPPELVGRTLVVQAPNHVQGASVIDLFVPEPGSGLQDGSGLEKEAELARARERLESLSERLKSAEAPGSGVDAEDIASLRREVSSLSDKVKELEARPVATPSGNHFKYAYVEIREKLGASKVVEQKLSDYYQRVNEHNKVAFADRRPAPVEPGQASYVGVQACVDCHQEEYDFWKTTRHSHAYRTLVDVHKEYNLDCVSCHVTGYERPGGSTVTHVEKLDAVQCEVCHGPGSLHLASPSDPKLIDMPRTDLCADSCHHPPHVKPDWKVSDAWPKILGPGHGLPNSAP